MIEYKKGSENSVVDTLSRKIEETLMAMSQLVPQWVALIKEEISINHQLQELVLCIQQGEAMGPWKVKGDLIYLNEIIYIISNSPLTESILKEIRDSTHKGYYKGLQQVRVAFYWHGIKSQLKKFIHSCDVRQTM